MTERGTDATLLSNAPPGGARFRLLVIGRSGMVTYPLTDGADVLIGRGSECRVALNEAQVSRRHAIIRTAPRLTVTDLGSTNGTFVAGQRLPPDETVGFSPGVVLSIGAATLVVQLSPASARLRHIRSHDYFEARVEEECARVEARGGAFAVVRLHCPAGRAGAFEDTFATLLRPMDVVALYAPHEYELLFVDTDAAGARALCDKLRQALAERGLEVDLKLACYPRDGNTPDSLLSSAAMYGDRLTAAPAQNSVVFEGALESVSAEIDRFAPGAISVLVVGETGVGKEVVAQRIHARSSRSRGALVCLNCAGLPETLLESELFGYERGAFTGASQAKPGLLESAHGGTVFLDEVGEMPLSVQAKLLRVLEQRQVLRLGALKPRNIDVRFVAATNRDLEAEIELGTFRRDLYFRLCGATIQVPALRERPDDIVSLAEHFARLFGARPERGMYLTPEAKLLLTAYVWPGNIREVRNVIERASLLSDGGVIGVEHLPTEKLSRSLAIDATSAPDAATRSDDKSDITIPPPPDVVPANVRPSDYDDRARVEAALATCGGNQSRAAEILGVSRRTLIKRIERYGLVRPRKAPNS